MNLPSSVFFALEKQAVFLPLKLQIVFDFDGWNHHSHFAGKIFPIPVTRESKSPFYSDRPDVPGHNPIRLEGHQFEELLHKYLSFDLLPPDDDFLIHPSSSRPPWRPSTWVASMQPRKSGWTVSKTGQRKARNEHHECQHGRKDPEGLEGKEKLVSQFLAKIVLCCRTRHEDTCCGGRMRAESGKRGHPQWTTRYKLKGLDHGHLFLNHTDSQAADDIDEGNENPCYRITNICWHRPWRRKNRIQPGFSCGA